jgi:hypothetical protein
MQRPQDGAPRQSWALATGRFFTPQSVGTLAILGATTEVPVVLVGQQMGFVRGGLHHYLALE